MKYLLVILSFILFGCATIPTNGVGKWEWKNGSIYEGEWKDSLQHGQGKYYANEEYYNMNLPSYVGEWKNDKQHGQGTIPSYGSDLSIKGKYVGEFKNGKRHGKGTYISASGEKSLREYKDGRLWKGVGYSDQKDGDYEGQIENGRPHGQGIHKCQDYQRCDPSGNDQTLEFEYVGSFKNGKYDGQGTLTKKGKSQTTYVGEWKNGKYNGQGTLTKKDKSLTTYVGSFKNGKYDGQGTLTNKDKSLITRVGKFKNGKIDQGTYTNSNGDSFVGEFKNGNLHKGTFSWSKGKAKGWIYEGNFSNNGYTTGTFTPPNPSSIYTTGNKRYSNDEKGRWCGLTLPPKEFRNEVKFPHWKNKIMNDGTGADLGKGIAPWCREQEKKNKQ
jgi:hypothetical protein